MQAAAVGCLCVCGQRLAQKSHKMLCNSWCYDLNFKNPKHFWVHKGLIMSHNFQVLILENCNLMHGKRKSEIFYTLSLPKACISKGIMFYFLITNKIQYFFIKIFFLEFHLDLFNVDVCIVVEMFYFYWFQQL